MEKMETYAYADSAKSQYVVDHAYDHVYESTTNPETKEHMYDAIIKNKLENVGDSNRVPQDQKEKKANPKTSKKLILLVVLTLVFFFCFIIVLILASRNHGFVFQNSLSGHGTTSGYDIPVGYPAENDGKTLKMTPSFQAFENYCVLIIEANYANGLYLDRSKLNEAVRMTHSVEWMENGKRWQTMTFLLPDGASSLYHPNKTVRFGFIQYGLDPESNKNYAFPSSYRFDAASCHGTTSGYDIPVGYPAENDGKTLKNTVMMFPRQQYRNVIEVITAHKINTLADNVTGKTSQFLESSNVIQRRIYNTDLMTIRNRIERKGISITSTNDSLVVAFSSCLGLCSADAYNGISVDHLGQDYIGVTINIDDDVILNGKHYLAVVAVYNDTAISYRLNTTNGKGWKNITLNSLETHQLSRDFGLTGSRIRGDKPFALFSGDEFSYENMNVSCVSHTTENLPKINDLGNSYIIPPFGNATSAMYMIVPTTPLTRVDIKTQTKMDTVLLGDNYIQKPVTSMSSYTYIETSEPVLMSVYVSFYSRKVRNLFVSMVIIPPVCQFSNDFVLLTPSFQAFENYCVLIIEANYANGLYLDRSKLNEAVRMTHSIEWMENAKRWQTMTFLLPDGASSLYHPNKTVRFGFIQYGLDPESKKNYAFPSSYRFDAASCK